MHQTPATVMQEPADFESKPEPSSEETIATLRAILESTSDGVVVTDSQRKVIFYNERLMKLWRIDKSIFGLPLRERMREWSKLARDPDLHIARLFEVYSHPERESHEVLEVRDGRTFERHSVPLWIRGKPAGRVWSMRDITERIKTEEALRAALKELTQKNNAANDLANAIIDNIPDMIYLKDFETHRMLRVNPAGEKILGLKGDVIGKIDAELFPEAAERLKQEDFDAYSLRGEALEIPEQPLRTVYGVRYVHKKKLAIRDPMTGRIAILGIAEEITEKIEARAAQEKLIEERIAREEFQRAIAIRDEFISIAAHELKTPLTALQMQIRLLGHFIPAIMSSDPVKGGKLVSLMSDSRAQLENFTKLVEDLLDVSRISSGRLKLEREPADLSAIVEGVLRRYDLEIRKSKCETSARLAPNLVGDFDPRRIEQVVVNLLTNALKYGAGRPVGIETLRAGRFAILRVQDCGIGIEKADQERIFNRFERAVPATTFGGFGLGLYISKQIVVAHGGTIRVESRSGEGACFIVDLPLLLNET